MNESVIVVRYAKAFFELAKEKNILKEIKTDITNIFELCKIKDIKKVLQNPIIKTKNKISLLTSLLMNYNVREETLSFIELIIKKNREPLLVDIARNFLNQYKKEKNIKTIYLTSVAAISEDTEKKIFKTLSNIYNANIEVKKKIDQSLIGGVIINVDNYQYDLSVRSRLYKIKNSLLKEN